MVEILDFYADWCRPCKMLAPVLDEIDAKYPDLKITKANVDEEPGRSLARQYGVTTIPTLIYLKGETEVTRQMGNQGKIPIENTIKQLINE